MVQVYVQCKEGLFHLMIGPAIKGSRKRQDLFEEALLQLKADLNSTFLLTIGQFIRLCWRTFCCESDRFDGLHQDSFHAIHCLLMLPSGNFVELIWTNAREADRYDTYELSKYGQPLAAQQLTAEVIYKFVIEHGKVRTLVNQVCYPNQSFVW